MTALGLGLGLPFTRTRGVPAWVPDGASLFYDFANSRYWNGSVIDLDTATNFAGGPGTYNDLSGVWSQFAINVPRITDKGVLVEPQGTNHLRNNTMNGVALGVIGSGGSLPTGWTIPTDGGLATEVLAAGTEMGIGYVDVRISGTPSAAYQIGMDSTTQIAALSGETWTESAFLSVSGGSIANITALQMRMSCSTSTGAFVSNHDGPDIKASLTGAAQRFSYTDALTGGATVAYVQPRLRLDRNGTAPIDITLRIGWPQQEKAATPSSPVLTSIAAVTRPADALTLNLPSGTHDLLFTFDDESTQEITSQFGSYPVPTNLNRRGVRSVTGFFQ